MIDEEEWKIKIFDDFRSPLEMLRQEIKELNLERDDLLHKFKLKIDNPSLDYPLFSKCLKIIDSSLNQIQIRSIFNELRNNLNGKVEIANMIVNLTGD